MPVYTYQCENCGQETDELVERSQKENPEITCSNCGSDSFERKLSAPSQIDNKMNSYSHHSCPGGSCGI
ncbi:MAG: zinc ribbon domain-containing protein [Candidatus Paceibacterota bacterium]